MSRSLFAVLLLPLLAACSAPETAPPDDAAAAGAATAPAPSAPPASGTAAPAATPPASATDGAAQRGCDAEAARGVVGEIATAEVVERARLAAGAQLARTLQPGQMVTMEYHPSRLNIDVDAGNTITNVRCG